MSRSTEPRSFALLAAGALVAATALPLLAAAPAQATPAGACKPATLQYRIPGSDWTSQGGLVLWKTPPGSVEVRLAGGQRIAEGCKYPVSLASYRTEGPDWFSSGRQTLIDKATVYLTAADAADKKSDGYQKLSVKTPDCFGQIDLYGDDITYDGGTGEGHGPAPYQPGGVNTPNHLIAAWNGGDKKCEDKQSPSPSPETPKDAESPSAPADSSTPSTPADAEPPASPSAPPSGKPADEPSTNPSVPPLEEKPKESEAKPQTGESAPPLAETGNGAPVGLIAGTAAVVVAAGAGALWFSRTRRNNA